MLYLYLCCHWYIYVYVTIGTNIDLIKLAIGNYQQNITLNILRLI